MKTAIFDLDGTLVFIPRRCWGADEFNWDNFIEWMNGNYAIESVVVKLKGHLLSGDEVIIVTARPETYRDATEELLESHGIPAHSIIMRTEEEVEEEYKDLCLCINEEQVKEILFSHHKIYRERVLMDLTKSNTNICYAYDDQLPNLGVWMSVGAECYLVDGNGAINGC